MDDDLAEFIFPDEIVRTADHPGAVLQPTCDNSPNRHATAHRHHHPDHRLIRSLEPGESWLWCYPAELFFEIDDAPPSPSHR